MIAIPPITAAAIEHRLQRLIRLIRRWANSWRTSWPNSYSGGCAELPAGMAPSHYNLRIIARSGLLDSALPAGFARRQPLLDQRLDQLLELERQLAEPWHHRWPTSHMLARASGAIWSLLQQLESEPSNKGSNRELRQYLFFYLAG